MERHVLNLKELPLEWDRQAHIWQFCARGRREGTVRKERGVISSYVGRHWELSVRVVLIIYPLNLWLQTKSIIVSVGQEPEHDVSTWFLLRVFHEAAINMSARAAVILSVWLGKDLLPSSLRLLDRGPHQGRPEMVEEEKHIQGRGTHMS